MITDWVFNMEQFIKCFTREDYEKILKDGHSFLYESNGVYWFSLNKSITFTNYNVIMELIYTSVNIMNILYYVASQYIHYLNNNCEFEIYSDIIYKLNYTNLIL